MAWTDKLERLKEVLPWRRDQETSVTVSTDREVEHVSDRPLLSPPISVYENAKWIVLEADVPGARPNTTHVCCNHDVLYVSATPAPPPVLDGALVTEQPDGSWYRRLQLPAYADGARASARLGRGVLRVTVPKRTDSRPRAIAVHAT